MEGGDWPAKGFTLIEVVLAVFFLAVGLLALVAFLVKLGSIEGASARRLYAAFCAQEKMEELEFRCATSAMPMHTHGREIVERTTGSFERTWKVAPYEAVEGIQEIEVTCTYQWKDGPQQLTLRSLVLP
jgi:Tfp pilus assembly protein PilV